MTWKISIDTGGTFTDAFAVAPDSRRHRVKILSSSALRVPLLSSGSTAIEIPDAFSLPDDFFVGFRANSETTVTGSRGNRLRLEAPLSPATAVELTTGEEAPVLAIRLLTHTALAEGFPPMELRIGTTRGTNALLENRGAPTAFFTSAGFGDLLTIGDQRRPDLFALQHRRRPPLQQATVEHSELQQTLTEAKKLLARGITSAAIALKNSYLDPAEEIALADGLRCVGFEHISISSQLAPLIKLLPRAQTAVVDAYLAPILSRFVRNITTPLSETDPLLMTSSGGLEPADSYHAKDSLLSGPAGGVKGAIAVAKAAGFSEIIAFDMGGTSTDVSRSSGQPTYQFEQRIGNAHLLSPSLQIETVAAGGGSICSLKPSGLSVGPESAGADPGPACYGKGGPLTLTDVNLLLGHIDTKHITIPLDEDASRLRLEELTAQITPAISEAALLAGLREIATERMADAIRRISIQEGFAPADHTLVAFGGAGPQHACAVAERLGISSILIPVDAGLLSAFGIHQSRIERIAQRQILQPLGNFADTLAELVEEAGSESNLEPIRQIAELRLAGQDAPLQIDIVPDMARAFADKFQSLFGYRPPADKQIELVSLRVIAATATEESTPETFCEGASNHLDPFSTLVVGDAWTQQAGSKGSQLLSLMNSPTRHETSNAAIEAELYRHRFSSIVTEMGSLLQRTAVSTNIRERADFSCALLDTSGVLVMSAPHVPVHLGALGVCVRTAIQGHPLGPGDMLVTNHPAFGGSHLPDITLISPVYSSDDQLIGYLANRAHHAEIGGITPGSMPPNATCLAEEGTVIPPTYLFKNGSADFETVATMLQSGPHPTRNLSDNLADLRAQVAANLRGVSAIEQLPAKKVTANIAGILIRSNLPELRSLPTAAAEEHLDDGFAIRVSISPGHIDFTGTTPETHPGNLNATPAIIRSAVLYALRLYLQIDIPLNEGVLTDIKITLPDCFLNPPFTDDPTTSPAVVGGNVETSQRVVDTILKALGIQACSQGTMNNFIFGNDSFGYYETIAGGTGSSPTFPGTDAIHSHMTNTAITDPEILESRYPVRLHQFSIRKDSGGKGTHHGGDGAVREFEFLEPLTVSLLTQHREIRPYGLNGASPGKRGRQTLSKPDGTATELPATAQFEAQPGDRLTIETPGGGGAHPDPEPTGGGSR